jgi:ATP-binding cassette subfamily F protein 3
MLALEKWNGGVIIISHDERFITTVAKEVRSNSFFTPVLLTPVKLWVCGDGTVSKFRGDVQSYKVRMIWFRLGWSAHPSAEPDRQQHQSEALSVLKDVRIDILRSSCTSGKVTSLLYCTVPALYSRP